MRDQDDDMRHVHGEGATQASRRGQAQRAASFYGGRQGD